DENAPFTSIYMLPMAHRTPEALEQVVANLGSYLFHELATPLGLKLEPLRQEEPATAAGMLAAPLRSFGTYAVWFPRGLLLRPAGVLEARPGLARFGERRDQARSGGSGAGIPREAPK